MALNQTQIDELNAAYNREGGQTETDKANIAYGQSQGWTPPVAPVVEQPIQTPTTPATDYAGLLPTETPEQAALRLEQERLGREAQTSITTPIDEAAIRAETEKRFQQEIDALNKVYAEKKIELNRQGQGRIGETTSLQARRGLIGSDFGSAQTETTRGYNQEIMNAAEAEQELKIQGVRNKISAEAKQEIADKKAAKEAGAATYLEFLKGAAERATTKVSSAVANMIASGVDYTDDQLVDLASQGKIDLATLKREYKTAKANQEAAAKEAALKGQFNLSEGEIRYDAQGNKIAGTAKPIKPEVQSVGGNLLQYNTTTGKWDTIFSAPKDTDKPTTQVIDKVLYQYDSITNKWTPVTTAIDTQSATALATLNDKKNDIDALKNSKGKTRAVGAYGIARWTPLTPDKADVQDFIAGVNNLISKDTLDTLINLKQAGGTLGALSDQERIMLQNAASKISSWAKKDEGGNTMYYNISEKLFDKELDRLKELTQRAIDKASTPIGGGNNADDPLGINGPSPFNQVGNTSASTTSYLNNYGPITGENGSPYWKWGLDVDLKKGDPVYAPVSGVVVQAGDKGDGFGNRVGIKTANGNIVYLAHLDGVDVKVGQTTTTNQLVGRGGNTGKTIAVGGGDGSHLDITVKKPDGTYYTPQEIKAKLS